VCLAYRVMKWKGEGFVRAGAFRFFGQVAVDHEVDGHLGLGVRVGPPTV
jgi:hypothetical protein